MRSQTLTLALAWLSGLNSRAPLLAIGPLLPLIVADLHTSFTIAGVLSGLPLLLMGLTGLPGGWLADRLGARRVMIGCLAGIAVAGLVRALAPDTAVLLLGTLVLGASIGTLQPALPRVARDTLPHRTRLASAICFNGLVVGGASGLALTPALASATGSWRGALIVWAIVGAVASGGWILQRPTRPSVLYRGRLSLADARQALRLPGMAALCLAMGTQSAVFYTFSSWAPTYLISRGWSLAQATLPVATLPVMSIVAGALAAPAEARFGRRAVIGASGGCVAVGQLLFLLWPDQTVWLCAITAGAGTTWAFSVCMAAPATLASAERVGITAGVLLALGYGEATIGPLALGSLRDAFGSYEAGWLLVVGLALVLTATAFGIPSRAVERRAPDQMERALEG